MRRQIRSPQFPLTGALKEHVSNQLAALNVRFSDHLRAIEVSFSDANGSRGGTDKVCHLQARVDKRLSINTEGRDRDLYAAINRAVRRMERSLERFLDGTSNRNPLSRNHSEFQAFTNEP